MTIHPNLVLIERFFDAYGRKDLAALREVASENMTWSFPGSNPLSGKKMNLQQVVAFFDAMGILMKQSDAQMEQLVAGVNDQYVVECQHIRSNRHDGLLLDHHWCVLWRFSDGKLISGKHFSEEQAAADDFFRKLLPTV